MNLKSFEIKNFRSITHAKCNLAGALTIFAGKNESGKTTILDALTALNDDSTFRESDRPLNHETQEDTVIEYNFELTKEEKEKCLKDFDLSPESTSNEVTIKKVFNQDTTSIDGPFLRDVERKLGKLSETDKNFINKNLESINKQLEKFSYDALPLFTKIDQDQLDALYDELNTLRDQIPKNPQNQASQQPALSTAIDEFIPNLNELRLKLEPITDFIFSKKPRVIKFSSFEDILPSEVPYSEFTEELLKTNHKIVYDLINLAEIDLEKVQSDDTQLRENLSEKAARITTRKFKEFWDQDQIEFIFRFTEPNVSIYVRDEGKETSFKPDQRSKGLQWFLSFYLRLNAEGRKENNLILIDEPGLYLHAKAQENVLKVLESESKHSQIIFTTHSPYLIDPNELNRIRLVVKDEKTDQTNITSSFYIGGDTDTLTPIITAIGLDLSKHLFFSKILNVVLEGISDYYYLRGMIVFLKNSEGYDFPDDISLISSIGNANVNVIVSILMGLGFSYKIILDNKGSSKIFNKLKRDGIEPDIIKVGTKKNDSIEDLFDKVDRDRYQIDDNSLSKAAISRRFYEKIKTNDFKEFSTTTITNFKTLLDKIKSDTPINAIEAKIDEVEKIWDQMSESMVVQFSLPISPHQRKELLKKYTTKLRSLGQFSRDQEHQIFSEFYGELSIKK